MDGYKKLTRNGLRAVFYENMRQIVSAACETKEEQMLGWKILTATFQGLVILNDGMVDAFNRAGESEKFAIIGPVLIPDPDFDEMRHLGILPNEEEDGN